MQENKIKLNIKRNRRDILNDSFLFIKQEFNPLSNLSLKYVLPFFIIYAIIQIPFQQKILELNEISVLEMQATEIGKLYANLLLILSFHIFSQALFIGVIYSYIEIYIKNGNKNSNIQEVASTLFSNSLLAFIICIAFTSIVFLGFLFLLIPGIYLANTLSIAIAIQVFEKKGIIHSFSLSWNMVNKYWWNTLSINITGILIILGISLLLSIPSIFFDLPENITDSTTTIQTNYSTGYWIISAITNILSSFLFAILYIFQAFQYFNLKNRMIIH